MLKRIILALSVISSAQGYSSEFKNSVSIIESSPSTLHCSEVIYERKIIETASNQEDDNFSGINGYVGVGHSQRVLKKQNETELTRNATMVYLGNSRRDGGIYSRVGLGYESGGGDNYGIMTIRLGYAEKVFSTATYSGFVHAGVERRQNFSDTEFDTVPSKSLEVFPYFGLAMGF